MNKTGTNIYRRYVKRGLDLILTLVVGVIFLPVILVLILFLCVEHNGKPFFFQERPGLKGDCFRIVKFRTMKELRDKYGNLLSDEDRITPFGKWLRISSLDELPQLWNVLVGEMSWVGPRPLLKKYLPLYSEEQFKRHQLRPGITGMAQVNGRKSLAWNQRFELDVWYVQNCSFELDVKILTKTLVKVIQHDRTDEDQEWTGN